MAAEPTPRPKQPRLTNLQFKVLRSLQRGAWHEGSTVHWRTANRWEEIAHAWQMAFWGGNYRLDAMMTIPDLERRGLVEEGTLKGQHPKSWNWEIRLTNKGRAFIERANSGAQSSQHPQNPKRSLPRRALRHLTPYRMARRWPRTAHTLRTSVEALHRIWRGILGH